ncbi:hypothetical protein [Pseudonocardia sp. HH130630-07]|uniref:hypothetical protein n=1 Tax=Pseudonocardia sp. HH130630-07 TaxID=1690815 RepID=UPI000814CA12|nr:hypothetical protein [Pseudonocardia sp. HH130630-07]ANY10528.1 hypothetical protein AFB00_29380 [Pseudonocardia sp. HH130630-07]
MVMRVAVVVFVDVEDDADPRGYAEAAVTAALTEPSATGAGLLPVPGLAAAPVRVGHVTDAASAARNGLLQLGTPAVGATVWQRAGIDPPEQ